MARWGRLCSPVVSAGGHWKPAPGAVVLNARSTVRNSHKWSRVVAPQRTLYKEVNDWGSRPVFSELSHHLCATATAHCASHGNPWDLYPKQCFLTTKQPICYRKLRLHIDIMISKNKNWSFNNQALLLIHLNIINSFDLQTSIHHRQPS